MRDPHLLRRLTAKDFQKWMWYEQVEPFGELRMDWRFAQLIAMVHNTQVDAKHQKKIEDFLLSFDAPKKARRRTPAEEARDLRIFISAIAGVQV